LHLACCKSGSNCPQPEENPYQNREAGPQTSRQVNPYLSGRQSLKQRRRMTISADKSDSVSELDNLIQVFADRNHAQ
jgi:hypothetical protein